MPSDVDSRIPVALAVLSGIIFAYSLLIAQQILLGVLAAGMLWFVYVFYLLVSSLSRIASALERIAAQRADQERPDGRDDH